MFLLTLVGGALADVVRPRRFLIANTALIALVVAAFAAVVASGRATSASLLATIFVLSGAWALNARRGSRSFPKRRRPGGAENGDRRERTGLHPQPPRRAAGVRPRHRDCRRVGPVLGVFRLQCGGDRPPLAGRAPQRSEARPPARARLARDRRRPAPRPSQPPPAWPPPARAGLLRLRQRFRCAPSRRRAPGARAARLLCGAVVGGRARRHGAPLALRRAEASGRARSGRRPRRCLAPSRWSRSRPCSRRASWPGPVFLARPAHHGPGGSCRRWPPGARGQQFLPRLGERGSGGSGHVRERRSAR